VRKRGLCCRPVSIRPSVTLVCSIHTTEDIVKLLSPPGSPITLVFDPRRRSQFQGEPVFILGLSGGKIPPKISEISPNFKMNYAKIEFLSISGMIFSPASGGFAPRPPPGLCPWSRFAITV